MVTSSGAKASPDRVRPLNLPRPIEIRLDAHTRQPIALQERHRLRAIERIQDSWQIDDEWWRAPISRRYLQVVLHDGALRTLFYDRIAKRWFEQAY